MSRPRILFAHERRGVARAVQRVLEREGFLVEHVADGVTCARRLGEERWSALVVDVALPVVAGYELVQLARDASPDAGAQVVMLVASVYRRTSYKRQPTRLYGADDYVEIHHLCDSLPRKLHQLLGLQPGQLSPAPMLPMERPMERPIEQMVEQTEAQAREELRVEGDTRMEDPQADQRRLASLIVADMVLYNGDAIHDAADLAEAESAVAPDLDIARQLFAQVVRAEGGQVPGDPIGEAFASLMGAMGRGGPT